MEISEVWMESSAPRYRSGPMLHICGLEFLAREAQQQAERERAGQGEA
jgi:hypothetical protein